MRLPRNETPFCDDLLLTKKKGRELLALAPLVPATVTAHGRHCIRSITLAMKYVTGSYTTTYPS
jgi:hypothetical protein